jgi:hypothetical protein
MFFPTGILGMDNNNFNDRTADVFVAESAVVGYGEHASSGRFVALSGVGGREVMLDADDAEGGLWRGHEGDHDAEWIGFWIFPR